MDAGEHEEESSVSRRERLIALRSAATAASSSASSPSAIPPLPPATDAWDLPEPDLMGASNPRPPPRFDFYTNPGAAFSSATAPQKRKSAYSPPPSRAPAPPYAGSGNYDNNYPPPRQHHMASPPIHYTSLPPPGTPGSIPWRSPMQFHTPVSGYGGTHSGGPPSWNSHPSPSRDSYPRPPSFGFRGTNVGQRGRPMYYGPRDGPYSSARGRGDNYHSSSRGRGVGGPHGFQGHSGSQHQRGYYNKRMVDDPWQNLQPIVGNILIPCKNWLPESLRAKKDTSTHGQIKPPSGLSLAEYLDLSFNEASNDLSHQD